MVDNGQPKKKNQLIADSFSLVRERLETQAWFIRGAEDKWVAIPYNELAEKTKVG